MLIVNPGSHLPQNPVGWSNTYPQAQKRAHEWLARMVADGFGDIEVLDEFKQDGDGDRWVFEFRHRVTGVVVQLATHGIDDLDAYMAQAIFSPRVYWKGSSSSNPELSDFAAPGYVMTYRKAEHGVV